MSISSLPRAAMPGVAAALTKPVSSANQNPAMFPLWNGAIGSQQVLRYLWDQQNNALPVAIKKVIKLPFDMGILGGSGNAAQVTLVSPETFGLLCPVTEGIRSWWNAGEDRRNEARRRYRSPQYIGNGFVVSTTIAEPTVPENPIRVFVHNKSLFENSIKQGLLNTSDDFAFAPWDPQEGRDFVVRKQQQGAWANYSSSSFAYKSRALSDVEVAAIEKYGVWDLSQFLGEPPTPQQIALIALMFEDSINDRPFDPAKYPGYRAFETERGFGGGAAPAVPTYTPPNGNGNGNGNADVHVEHMRQMQADSAPLLAALKAKTTGRVLPPSE